MIDSTSTGASHARPPHDRPARVCRIQLRLGAARGSLARRSEPGVAQRGGARWMQRRCLAHLLEHRPRRRFQRRRRADRERRAPRTPGGLRLRRRHQRLAGPRARDIRQEAGKRLRVPDGLSRRRTRHVEPRKRPGRRQRRLRLGPPKPQAISRVRSQVVRDLEAALECGGTARAGHLPRPPWMPAERHSALKIYDP